MPESTHQPPHVPPVHPDESAGPRLDTLLSELAAARELPPGIPRFLAGARVGRKLARHPEIDNRPREGQP